ncbi:MAG: anthranilate phosphoribosyltransferase [Pseudomonadota bacterium]
MSDAVRNAIATLADGGAPDQAAITSAFNAILGGEADPILISAFLMGLRLKGESVDDITAAAAVMRARAKSVDAPDDVVDTCGTGGLGWTTLNTSTASAFVVAGAGGRVAKHGNRSVPPKTGSADVLEALGVNLTPSEAQFAACLEHARVAFMFAQAHHSAMRHVAPVRKMLGLRTIFNLLGPLSNPAGAKRQVLGVFDEAWVEPLAHVLKNLGSTRAMVVHGMGGLDEISIAGDTKVAELKDGAVTTYTLTPQALGLTPSPLETLKGGAPETNAQAIRDLLDGAPGPFHDIVALNAGAALYISDLADTLDQGLSMAKESLQSGAAKAALAALVKHSNEAAA